MLEYWCQATPDISRFSVSYSQTLFFIIGVFSCLSLADVIPRRGIIFSSMWIQHHLAFSFPDELKHSSRNSPVRGTSLNSYGCVLLVYCVCVMNGKLWIATVIKSHCLVIPVPASSVWVWAEVPPRLLAATRLTFSTLSLIEPEELVMCKTADLYHGFTG